MKKDDHQTYGFVLRVLTINDLHDVATLHREIRRSLIDSSFLCARNTEFFERLIASEGVIVGAFRDERLIAYSAVILPGAQALRCDYALAHLSIDGSVMAFGSGCGVHPEHRREGLFKRLIGERTRQAALRGCSHVTAVVSPWNEASLRALHDLGHAAVGLHHDEDGENFLLVAPTVGRFPVPRKHAILAPIADLDENLRILREGPSVGLPLHANGEPVFAYIEPSLFPAQSLVSG
jgi:GNAT superfamily N-acetyltransferase